MDGFEFLKKIKSDKMKSNIPVFVMSSNINKDDQEKAKALGAINYFVKNNFKQTTFVKQIKEVLSK